MRADTLSGALLRAADFPEAGLRLLDRRERATWLPWSELAQRARRVSGGLLSLGLEPGEVVPLVYPTGEDFFSAFFGVLLAGGVPAPLYPPVRLGRMEEYHARTGAMVQAVGSRWVLTGGRVRRLLGTTLKATGASPLSLGDLPEGQQIRASSPDDLGLVQFSSGTTVAPKPVALTHRALIAQSDAIESYLVDDDSLTHAGVSWLPLYHDMGLIGCVLPALCRPGVLTLLPPEAFVARPALWLRALSRYGGTVSPAPNFAYALCVDRIRDEELDGVDLSAWRLALNGAEPVAPAVLRAFTQRFARWGLRESALTPVYGLSEAALAVTFSQVDAPFRTVRREDGVERVSLGTPVPGFEVQIRDPGGAVLPKGEEGRVWCRGPSLMREYLGRPEATARALVEGWLDTGDQGFLLGGELFLVGRAKDLLVLRGRNHPPQAVEQAVDEVPGVRSGCAAAVSHLPEGGATESLVLLVEHRQGEPLAPAACREAVLTRTGLACDQVVVLEPGTLPRTSSGKIRRGEALRRYLDGTLAPPEKVSALKVVGWMIRSAIDERR